MVFASNLKQYMCVQHAHAYHVQCASATHVFWLTQGTTISWSKNRIE